MAEGLAKSMGFEAASAGTHPAQAVAQHAIALMNGKGISTDGMTPKSLDEFDPEAFDMVISMGCGVHCPAIKIDQDWALEDPVGQAYEVYEATAADGGEVVFGRHVDADVGDPKAVGRHLAGLRAA